MDSHSAAPERVVVAATDLSPSADQAVARAARLAARWGDGLCLLHVLNDRVWATIKAIYKAEQWLAQEPILATRDRLARQAQELASHYRIPVSAETRTGLAAAEISAFVRERKTSLLVVGEHGEDWMHDAVIGGTALKALKQASVPVLLARRPADREYQTVLTATDFSDSALRAARLSFALFPLARHYLLHAYSVPFEGRMRMAGASGKDIARYREEEKARADSRMQAELARLGAPRRHVPIIAHGYAGTIALEYSKGLEAELIVVGKHGGPPLEERLLGSVPRNVLYSALCDVLLVP